MINYMGAYWSSRDGTMHTFPTVYPRIQPLLLLELRIKQNLVTYNLEDCQALEVLTETLLRICSPDHRANLECGADPEVALAGNSTSRDGLWRRFSSPIADFEVINKAARWDYQRDRVYVRTDKLL